jgi:hypothetical protein
LLFYSLISIYSFNYDLTRGKRRGEEVWEADHCKRGMVGVRAVTIGGLREV